MPPPPAVPGNWPSASQAWRCWLPALPDGCSRGIVLPIVGMTDAMRRLAAGDHQVVLPARHGDDEIGRMARAVEVFRANAIERSRLQTEQQLERRAQEEKKAALLAMAATIEAE